MSLGLSFIGWIVIGGLAGWVASMIKGTNAQQGLLLNIIVGVIGGQIGAWILKLFNIDPAGTNKIVSFLTCLVGAVILLTIYQYFAKKK